MNIVLNNSINHVIIVIMENKEYTQVIGPSDALYQNELAKKYCFCFKVLWSLSNSLPNYLSIMQATLTLLKIKILELWHHREPTIVNDS